jgi:hypothetical protein
MPLFTPPSPYSSRFSVLFSAFSALLVSTISNEIKAAVAQVGGRDWNWRMKILCPTIQATSTIRTARLAQDGSLDTSSSLPTASLAGIS